VSIQITINIARKHWSGRTIAIVGNSPKIFERKDGEEIDEADKVFRFNMNLPDQEGDSESMGTRTDVMVGATGRLRDLKPQQFVTICRQPLIHCNYHFPSLINRRLVKAFGAEPSTGMILLEFLSACETGPIKVYGFDGLRTRPRYRKGATHTARHWIEAEDRMRTYFKNTKGVEFVDYE